MRTLIIEDEPAAARRLVRLLAIAAPEAEVVATLRSVHEATEWLSRELPPELVFLDIELGDGLGFDIVARTALSAPVIFTTAFDAYALRAFEANSVDYLLKPIEAAKLAVAIDRFRRRTAGSRAPQVSASVAPGTIEPQPHMAVDRFLVRRGPRLLSVAATDIAYAYRDGLVYLVTAAGDRFAVDHSLDRIAERLNPPRFMRLDRRTLAAIDAVVDVVTLAKSRLRVKLHPKPPFDPVVSQERAAIVKGWLGA